MRTLVLLFCLAFGFSLNGQTIKCGNVLAQQLLEKNNPGISDQIEKIFLQAKENQNAKSGGILTIPVVVHILYNANAENLSDAVVFDQLAVLNRDFNRLNPDTVNTRDVFKPVAGNAEIEFKLAGIDPDGNPTTGITRTQTDKESFIELDFLALFAALEECGVDLNDPASLDENIDCVLEAIGGLDIDAIKSEASGGKAAWDTEKYLNIWVGNMSASLGGMPTPFILGFAYPPVGAPNWPADTYPDDLPSKEGVVIHYEAFGSNNPDPGVLVGTNDQGKTCVHEVGHYLGLRHVWGDGDCTEDDGIEDTPSMDSNSQVEAGATIPDCTELHGKNTCSNDNLPDMVENYMDYSPELCQNMFTVEQVSLMRAMLEGPRVGLLGGQVLSTNDISIGALEVYPNPTMDILNIEFDQSNAIGLEILRHDGTSVNQMSFTNQIDISNYPVGIYLIKVTDEDKKVWVNKIVKQ